MAEASSNLIRGGLLLAYFAVIVRFMWWSVVSGNGGEFPEQTQRMIDTPRRKWTELDKRTGDVVSANNAKILRPLVRPANVALVVGPLCAVAGLLLGATAR